MQSINAGRGLCRVDFRFCIECLGGCPRIEAYCGKTDFGPCFRLNSFNTASIRLIESKQWTQNRFPSLRLLFSDSLLALPITHKSCVTRYGLQNVEVSKYRRLQGVFHEKIFFWVTKTNENNEQYTYSENLIF